MAALEVGKIYLCADGYYRKLTKVDSTTIHYEYPAFHKGKVRWLGCGQTPRKDIEREFLRGKIVEEEEMK